jgi:nitrogen fixation protein FixH
MTEVAKSKGFFYFFLLLLVGLAANALGLFGGFRIGQGMNGLLAALGVSFERPGTSMLLPFFLAVVCWAGAAGGVIWYSVTRQGRFMGGHAVVSFLLIFTSIVAANMTLATKAVSTFPGLEVKNSYIASQTFDDRRQTQEALGWTVEAKHTGGLLILAITDTDGRPVQAGKLDAVLGRPTHVQDDRTPEFQFDGTAYVARETLAPGNWNIRMKANALDGTPFEQRVVFYVKG